MIVRLCVTVTKILDINNAREGIIYFGSQFQKAQSMIAWPYVLRQNIMVVLHVM